MWKHAKGNAHYLTEQANRYYQLVRQVVMTDCQWFNLDFPLEVRCVLCPPDNKRRDLENAWKVISDGITKAGVWQDDSLIKKLTLEWGEVDRYRGHVRVHIAQRDAESVTC